MQVYFLCTGNSCRSQMAEGFARALAPGWTVGSAGLERHGLNPQAVAVMAEVGIDISQQVSKLIAADFLAGSDLVVTLCGDARDRCPVVPGVKLHWPLPDPAGQELAVFRQVRDDIQTRVAALVAAHN